MLGIFFDRGGTNCSGDIPIAGMLTLHVVLLPDGATYSGITGAEFRIETGSATGYLFQGETVEPDAFFVGSALGSGINVAFPGCRSGTAVPLLRFQVFNAGAGVTDGEVRVSTRRPPSNLLFPCALAVECDDPVYTKVCVDGGRAILNPSGQRPCGSSRLPSEWSRVKELYR
jgi:hypothetical protein